MMFVDAFEAEQLAIDADNIYWTAFNTKEASAASRSGISKLLADQQDGRHDPACRSLSCRMTALPYRT